MSRLESSLQQTTIVIPTYGRAHILHDTVVALRTQTIAPQGIIVSAGNQESVLLPTRSLPGVEVLIPPQKGLPAQRNASIPRITTPYTLFLDDDVELASDYIASMQLLFGKRPDLHLAMADMAADGARTDTGYSHARAQQILLQHALSNRITPVPSVIGCNMFVRTDTLRAVCFDERLPLYGWLEDLDFSTRVRRLGGIVINGYTAMVHLGTPSGRISGLRLGYSQIVNPIYLWKKSGEPSIPRLLIHFWLRLILSNLIHSAIPTRNSRQDRRGRLRGNILAFIDLLRLRVTPERILSLHQDSKPQP